MRIIFYLPYNASPRGQWIVRRNADLAGQFATRDEALTHAHLMVGAFRALPGNEAELKIEDENGNWRLDAASSEASAS